jgi:hypothetical protein
VTLRPSRFLLPRDRVLASQGKQRAGLTPDQQTGHFSVFMDRTFSTVTDRRPSPMGYGVSPKALQWKTQAQSFDKPLCCAQDGFTLRASRYPKGDTLRHLLRTISVPFAKYT